MGYTPAIPIFNGNMLIKHWILGKPIFNQTQIIEPELLSDENGWSLHNAILSSQD